MCIITKPCRHVALLLVKTDDIFLNMSFAYKHTMTGHCRLFTVIYFKIDASFRDMT